MDVKLYVGNLSHTTTEDDLRTLFAQAGTVASVAVIKDRETGASKGFAFVEMTNDEEAQRAIDSLNGKEVDGRAWNVNEARPKAERSGPRPGGGFNRGGGGGRGGYGRGGNGGGYGRDSGRGGYRGR